MLGFMTRTVRRRTARVLDEWERSACDRSITRGTLGDSLLPIGSNISLPGLLLPIGSSRAFGVVELPIGNNARQLHTRTGTAASRAAARARPDPGSGRGHRRRQSPCARRVGT